MAVAALAAVRRQRSTGARAAVGLAIVVLVAAPVLWANANVGERLATRNTSFELRKMIWSDTVRVMEDFPVVGTGFNTLAAAMRVYQTASDELMVLEAHNDYLQLAAEGGLLMGVPIVLTLVLFADGIRRRFSSGEDDPATSWIRFGAATAVAAIALQSVVEFSLQMPGNAVTFVVVATIALHRPSQAQDSATAVRPVVRRPLD
jgi:O-antigen ligase